MKRVVPDGGRIKGLRINSEHASTQKELAHEVRVSERTLRAIENKDAAIGVDVLDRLAKWFGVHREQLVKPSGSSTVPGPKRGSDLFQDVLDDLAADRIVPRHDYDLAYATTDEGVLFKEASRSHDVACSIDMPLTDETAGYAQELFEILGSLTWGMRDCRIDIPPTEEIVIRRRIKMLLVLLKGNDIWTYQTSFFRRLPERFEPLPAGEYPDLSSRMVVALGPPGEYGEESIRVPIDHGQPFFLPGWKLDSEARDGGA
jgi:transcriptional regulator with XRE-family HTH domain